MNSFSHYKALAGLFEYPDSRYPFNIERAIDRLEESHSDAAAELKRFRELFPAGDVKTMQELFLRTFDIQAVTTLDIGYVLFGDDYKRGELLANLNREHQQAGNDCGSELADHLPNILRLIAELDDEELRAELVLEIVAPALAKMIGEFLPGRIEMKNDSYRKHYKTLIETPSPSEDLNTVYRFPLNAVFNVLKQDFALDEQMDKEETSDFLKSVAREIVIEEQAEDPSREDIR